MMSQRSAHEVKKGQYWIASVFQVALHAIAFGIGGAIVGGILGATWGAIEGRSVENAMVKLFRTMGR